MHWYKRDPHAALDGTAGMTWEEVGAYTLVQDLLYARDGVLPDDDAMIARIMRVRVTQWRRMKARLILLGKVWSQDGFLMARRVERTLEVARKLSETQAEIAHKRWQQPQKHSDINDAPMPTDMPSGNASKTKSRSREEEPLSVNEHNQEFEQFWQAYPRKENREAAQLAFARAIKKTTLAVILAALDQQRPRWRDPQFIPHPASWLNGQRWLDEITPAGAARASSGPMTEERMAALEERYRQKRIREGWTIPPKAKP